MRLVMDSSAVLDLLNAEVGADVVRDTISEAAISAVNVSEVVAKLAERGMPGSAISETLEELGLEIIPFDADQALATGLLRPITRDRGLSLGDRACLALGISLGCGVLTADRQCATLDLGVEVRLAR